MSTPLSLTPPLEVETVNKADLQQDLPGPVITATSKKDLAVRAQGQANSLTSIDPMSPEFQQLIKDIEAIGNRTIKSTTDISNHLLDSPETALTNKGSGGATAILTVTGVVGVLSSTRMIDAIISALGDVLRGHSGAGSDQDGPTPNPSPAPSETATPAPEPPPQDTSPPPWEWIGFAALAVLAAAVLVALLVVAIRLMRRGAAKRRITKRKALERQQLRARHRADWSALRVKEKALGARWLQYEDSLELILRYPVMRDLNDPKIAPVVEAMGRAKAYRTEEPPDLDVNPVETEYARAVTAFESAFDEAERYAKKIRWNRFAPEEQKKAKQALKLLKMAMDTTNYPAERRTAYERVARIMEDLMIPAEPRVLLAIEEDVGRLELTAR